MKIFLYILQTYDSTFSMHDDGLPQSYDFC